MGLFGKILSGIVDGMADLSETGAKNADREYRKGNLDDETYNEILSDNSKIQSGRYEAKDKIERAFGENNEERRLSKSELRFAQFKAEMKREERQRLYDMPIYELVNEWNEYLGSRSFSQGMYEDGLIEYSLLDRLYSEQTGNPSWAELYNQHIKEQKRSKEIEDSFVRFLKSLDSNKDINMVINLINNCGDKIKEIDIRIDALVCYTDRGKCKINQKYTLNYEPNATTMLLIGKYIKERTILKYDFYEDYEWFLYHDYSMLQYYEDECLILEHKR